MARISIVSGGAAVLDDRPPPGYAASGAVTSKAVSPAGFSLWLRTVDLADGAMLTLPARHGDEALFVLDGALEVAGSDEDVPAHGVVIAEADVPLSVRAQGPTHLVCLGPVDPEPPSGGRLGPPATEGRSLHVVGPRGRWYFGTDESDAAEGGRYYADASCPTCRLSLHLMHHNGGHVQEAHSHSEDELMHVLTGALQVGRRLVGAGDTLAVAGGTRYRFTSPDGFVAINYRRDASIMSFPDGRPDVVEGAAAHNLPSR